ncbi:hypothetical protein [Nocardia pseudovaccinii]|uniref:hypothetical protein n=1 Tax=Nocardia pseudovaccinii TaxID=189540 RepID=UPI0007A53635|nr:hypothetical protein [Nocardia pseudovaccinii]
MPKSPLPLPDWAAPGAAVVILADREDRPAVRNAIREITPKAIILDDGTRFLRSQHRAASNGDHYFRRTDGIDHLGTVTEMLVSADGPSASSHFARARYHERDTRLRNAIPGAGRELTIDSVRAAALACKLWLDEETADPRP